MAGRYEIEHTQVINKTAGIANPSGSLETNNAKLSATYGSTQLTARKAVPDHSLNRTTGEPHSSEETRPYGRGVTNTEVTSQEAQPKIRKQHIITLQSVWADPNIGLRVDTNQDSVRPGNQWLYDVEVSLPDEQGNISVRHKTTQWTNPVTREPTLVEDPPRWVIDLSVIMGGGMGKAYKVYDTTLHRVEVAKVVEAPKVIDIGELNDMLYREAITLAQLQHPNIATVHAFLPGERPVIIMEYIEGSQLTEGNGYPFEASKLIRYFCGLADAIDYTSKRGIYHSDIKPKNILVDTNTDIAKLIDYGAANTVLPADLASMTPRYSAPEIKNKTPPSIESEVYSLAKTLTAVLIGDLEKVEERDMISLPEQIPADAFCQLVETNYALYNKEPLPRGVLRKIGTVIYKATEHYPDERYHTAKEFVDAFTACLETTI